MDPAALLRQAAEDLARSQRLTAVNPMLADALWKRSLILARQASEMAECLSVQEKESVR